MGKPTCTVDGCDRRHYGRGYCRKHWQRWRTYGTHTLPAPPSLAEKMKARTKRGPSCWLWVGAKSVYGYGQVTHDGKNMGAHRVAYELAKGGIPEGMRIDHICRTPPCVNPEHLRVVNIKQNVENHGGAMKSSKSGVRNVYWHKGWNKWWVQVAHNGQRYDGGGYDSLDEADEAARALRNKLHTHNNIDRIVT